MTKQQDAIQALAHLHHQYFLGLQLMVAVEEGRQVIGDWTFRLFRRQHEEKFLSSFQKLGLDGLPHAVACARYHAVSNGVGGVRVEYMEENSRKAWVRFRYPRWMYDGPTVCGIPMESGRGFLTGWYAHNGVSLQNPRLGFVCVSEDLTGQFGLCGYFREFDHDLSPEERLQFAPDEVPPPFDPAAQPTPPDADWPAERLAKAARNYAMEYCRNGIAELISVLGHDRALELGQRAARLTGLQQYSYMSEQVGTLDGGIEECAKFLQRAFAGMGDSVEVRVSGDTATLHQTGLRILRGLDEDTGKAVMACWIDLWRGAVHAHRTFMDLQANHTDNTATWTLSRR